MTFLKLEQFMKILYPDSISGYPDIRILYPDIRILYPKLVCFGYHFLENFPVVERRLYYVGGVAEGEALWDLLMIMALKALLLPLLLTTVRYFASI